MRFASLKLERYGCFTEKELVFRPGASLHLVFGENEAGKSTSLSAITDLLFGIENRTTYDFQHPGQLSLGGTIVTDDGQEFSFKRRKGTHCVRLAGLYGGHFKVRICLGADLIDMHQTKDNSHCHHNRCGHARMSFSARVEPAYHLSLHDPENALLEIDPITRRRRHRPAMTLGGLIGRRFISPIRSTLQRKIPSLAVSGLTGGQVWAGTFFGGSFVRE